MEAWTGFEPVNDGFANHCLTTWRPGHILSPSMIAKKEAAVKAASLYIAYLITSILISLLPKEIARGRDVFQKSTR